MYPRNRADSSLPRLRGRVGEGALGDWAPILSFLRKRGKGRSLGRDREGGQNLHPIASLASDFPRPKSRSRISHASWSAPTLMQPVSQTARSSTPATTRKRAISSIGFWVAE